jgi:hypothetical protein
VSYVVLSPRCIQAKRHTGAAQGDAATAAPLLPGTRQLAYREGPFFDRDIYVGTAYFAGQEIVSYQDQAVWSMTYAGGIVPALSDRREIAATCGVRRKALRRVAADQPYRGPPLWEEGLALYTNHSQGAVDELWRHEVMTRDRQRGYELRYSGGGIR